MEGVRRVCDVVGVDGEGRSTNMGYGRREWECKTSMRCGRSGRGTQDKHEM